MTFRSLLVANTFGIRIRTARDVVVEYKALRRIEERRRTPEYRAEYKALQGVAVGSGVRDLTIRQLLDDGMSFADLVAMRRTHKTKCALAESLLPHCPNLRQAQKAASFLHSGAALAHEQRMRENLACSAHIPQRIEAATSPPPPPERRPKETGAGRQIREQGQSKRKEALARRVCLRCTVDLNSWSFDRIDLC